MNMKEYAFGIDLGGTTAKIGLFTTSGALLEKWEVATDTSNAGEHILENLAAAVQGKMQEKGLAAEQVEGVGVGVPGPVLDSRIVPIVCANLPYNITTPVLTKFVETPAIETVTVLIQKEAAQRLTSAKGSADGAFPLRLQYEMETECLFDVPPEKFLPAPKVTSTVLRCVRRKEPPVAVRDEAFFFRVIKGAFLLRRKTLSNSLSAALPGWDKAAIADAIAACGLPASVRGEALTLTEFAALTDALAERK